METVERTDFGKNPLKEGDFVACLSKSYQVLRLAKVVRFTEKTILVALFDQCGYAIPEVIKEHKKGKAPNNYCFKRATYRTDGDCLMLINKNNVTKMADYSDNKNKLVDEYIDIYNALKPEKPAKGTKVKKSDIKI